MALLLAACGQLPDPTPIPTEIVEVRPPPASPPGQATPASQIVLVQGACVDQARFIEDLSVPDGSRVEPGALIDKRWSVLNSGTCDWGPGYRLIRTDTGSLGGPAELALYPARAGEAAIWQVLLTAPREPGQQLASWQARSPSGELFGDPVFVLVEVGS
ncbi:MAG: NBR1-Ig-like domain-containing protein [Anaerolineales bacterium]